jgi:hypothetical protein
VVSLGLLLMAMMGCSRPVVNRSATEVSSPQEQAPAQTTSPTESAKSGLSGPSPGIAPEKGAAFDPKTIYRIEPGKSIGPVRVGITDEEARALGSEAWGEEPVLIPPAPSLSVSVRWEGTRVVANAAGPEGQPRKVVGILTSNPRFHTAGGIGVGSTYDAAKRSLGRPDEYSAVPGMGARAGWRSGVWVDVDTKRRVVTIGVQKP